MTSKLKRIAFVTVFALAITCFAQEGFTVRSRGRQQWPADEAQRIYESACVMVQHEFATSLVIRPQFTLVLGAEKDEVDTDHKEIRLTKWDRYLFAQGAIMLAFAELLPMEKRTGLVKRAVTWADSTIEVKRSSK